MLKFNKRLSDDAPHYRIGYHCGGYITDMTDYIVRTDLDNETTQLVGLELEISRGDKTITQAIIDKMIEIFPFIQISDDSTIPGEYSNSQYVEHGRNTCEIQTAPMTINALKESGFYDFLQYLRDKGFVASAFTNFDYGTGCGGHIHISKGDKWQDIVALMVMFLDQNKEIVQIICKRPFTNYAQNNLRGLGKSIRRYSLQGVKEYVMSNTYIHENMINLQHENTIEFRLPIGTLNTNTKMAHIEFITNLYKCCEDIVNGKARIDRLTINKVCQDGEYLPNYIKELCISCSKKLIVMDGEIKKKVKELETNKIKLVKILSQLQLDLGTTRDTDIRQGSINTISNRFNEITNASTIDNLLVCIKRLKYARTISDGLEEYILTHDNNIARHYKQLKEIVNEINVEDIYYNILEEV